jgi:GR25 family glycosyltransferase involved in LPS biosynthesis
VKAFVITLCDNEYSLAAARRCIASAKGVDPKLWPAFAADEAMLVLGKFELQWTWGRGGAGMNHHSYGGNLEARIACALSHYMLWGICSIGTEPVMILEHDAVFVREFEPFEFDSICMINDPKKATPRWEYWRKKMISRGPGVWQKTVIFPDDRPDGLAGNSAYVIKPDAARRLRALVDQYGLWPNDAIMCRQLIPELQEHYPFITEVQAERSTIQI